MSRQNALAKRTREEMPAGIAEPPGGRNVGRIGTIILLIYLLLLTLGLFYGLVLFWPEPGASEGSSRLTSGVVAASDEVRLIVVVALAGSAGSMVHAVRSYYKYVGSRTLKWSWVPMYLLLPIVGATLAMIFYLVIRGGFFSPEATIDETSPFGFAALAALVGLFTEQAAKKLKTIASTVFEGAEVGSDPLPQAGEDRPASAEA